MIAKLDGRDDVDAEVHAAAQAKLADIRRRLTRRQAGGLVGVVRAVREAQFKARHWSGQPRVARRGAARRGGGLPGARQRLRALALPAEGAGMTGSGAGARPSVWRAAARAGRRRRSLMLAYHGVEKVPAKDDPEGLCIDPARFRAQIGLLVDAGFEFVTAREYVARGAHEGEELGLATITFDDGLENLHRIALPIMRELGVTATVYVPSGLIGRAYPWRRRSPSCGSWASPTRELAAAGIEIGAHTVTHPDLSICSYEECLQEMADSKRALEAIVGEPVATFAYPFARFSPEAERAAADTASAGAVTYSTLSHDGGPYAIPRELVTGRHGSPEHRAEGARHL